MLKQATKRGLKPHVNILIIKNLYRYYHEQNPILNRYKFITYEQNLIIKTLRNMSQDFRFMIGDIIQLRQSKKNSNPFKSEGPRLFKIIDITGENVRLNWQMESFHITDLKPIAIDTAEDAQVILKHKGTKYSFVVAGMQRSNASSNLGYYLESMKELGWDDLIQRIKAKEITFVNEVQRYINSYFNEYYLDLNS